MQNDIRAMFEAMILELSEIIGAWRNVLLSQSVVTPYKNYPQRNTRHNFLKKELLCPFCALKNTESR